MFPHEDVLRTFIFVDIARFEGYLVLCFEVDFSEKAGGFYRLCFDFVLSALLIGHTKIGDPVLFMVVFGREMHYYYYYFSKKMLILRIELKGNLFIPLGGIICLKSPKISLPMIIMAQ